MGTSAIAITDHGVVQSFPEANHAYDDIVSDYRKQYQKDHPEATKDEMKQVYPPFKVIYGVEAYLVDDVKGMVTGSRGQSLDDPCRGIWISKPPVSVRWLTGSSRLVQFEWKRVPSWIAFPSLSIRRCRFHLKIEQLTGINDSMVVGCRDHRRSSAKIPGIFQGCGHGGAQCRI